jgi:hypothetical protein
MITDCYRRNAQATLCLPGESLPPVRAGSCALPSIHSSSDAPDTSRLTARYTMLSPATQVERLTDA